MGAGGGGFFMFYCRNGNRSSVTEALTKMGLRRERFQIEWNGVKTLLNTDERLTDTKKFIKSGVR
jgi:D-glycero-alpha-D-manno-heptose-7-phosphate kinase